MRRSGSETNRADVSSGGSDHERAPVTLYVGSLEGLNPNGDPYGLSQRWKRWEEAFKICTILEKEWPLLFGTQQVWMRKKIISRLWEKVVPRSP